MKNVYFLRAFTIINITAPVIVYKTCEFKFISLSVEYSKVFCPFDISKNLSHSFKWGYLESSMNWLASIMVNVMSDLM
jgi:hypothetical protein